MHMSPEQNLCLMLTCMVLHNEKRWTNKPFYLPLNSFRTQFCQFLESSIKLRDLQPVYALFNLRETRQNV